MFRIKTRRERESVIVKSMIKMYCRAHHDSTGNLCPECLSLSTYSEKRLLSCMYGDIKPVCKECPVHCYSPIMREQMRMVMRWAGPRMIFRRPVFAIAHMVDNLKSLKAKSKSVAKEIRKK